MSQYQNKVNELEKIIARLTTERNTMANTINVLEQTIIVLKETNELLMKDARQAENWAKKLEKSNAELTQHNIELLKENFDIPQKDLFSSDLESLLLKPKAQNKTIDQLSDQEINELIERNMGKNNR